MTHPSIPRPNGGGWLVLLGGGEFSFGETGDVDEAWLAKLPESGAIGFLPTASSSNEYGQHFSDYMAESFGRKVFTIPVYRDRDAKRVKNCDRLASASAVYVGGGVVEHLLEPVLGSPFADALLERFRAGLHLVAISAGAQAFGAYARKLLGREIEAGFQWLPGTVVETNFDPDHDRRLRELMRHPGVRRGLGIPAESALMLGPDGEVELVGTVYFLSDADGEYELLE